MPYSLHFSIGHLLELGNICNYARHILSPKIVDFGRLSFAVVKRSDGVFGNGSNRRMRSSMRIPIDQGSGYRRFKFGVFSQGNAHGVTQAIL